MEINERYKETPSKSIEDIFNREYNYVDYVFDNIVGIMCNVHNISEKNFKSWNNIKNYVETYFDNNQGILLEIDGFNQSKKRAEYCAEFLFDTHFNGIILADKSNNLLESLNDFITFDKFLENKKEMIKGGTGSGMSLKDIAEKHSVTLDYIEKQYEIGKLVEIEHSENKNNKSKGNHKISDEIAKDHLSENPKYYTDLVESGMVDEIVALDKYIELFGNKEKIKKLYKNKI